MRRSMILLAAILVLAGMASTSFAQSTVYWERADRWDFSIQTRYTDSQDYTGDNGSSASINSDLGWGFGFSYNLSNHFNLGMAFTWRSVPYSATAVSSDTPGDLDTYSGNLSTSTFAFTSEYYVLKGRFSPYVNGSLGWMHVNSNVFAGYSAGCWWDPWWGYVCGSVPTTYGSDESVYSLGLGVRYEITDAVFLRGGYEKGWTSANTFDNFNMMRIDIGFMF